MAVQIGQMLVMAVISFAERKSSQIGASTAAMTAKREAVRRNQQKVDVEYAGGTEPRRRLYGNFRAAGLNALPPITDGTSGERLHKISVLSDGLIESIDAYNYNEDRFLADTINPANGQLTSGKFQDYTRVYPHLGVTPNPAEEAAMNIVGWTGQHRGDGVAYVYMTYLHSPEKYKGGAPEVIFEGKGNLVYIPRDDTSPGAHPADYTYYAFSKNPAEQLADFLIWTSGGNVSTSKMAWSTWVDAANVCDESVTVPAYPSGTTTQPRFTSSTEVYTPLTLQERDETIKRLARAFMGVCWYSGGTWRAAAGAFTTPVGSIVDNDLAGERVSVSAGRSRSSGERFNTVRGIFIDESELSQEKSFPEVSSSLYVTQDGEVIHTNVEYLTVRNTYEAQRNAAIELFCSRTNTEVSGTFKFRCRKFHLYDIVTATIAKAGWVNQTARIVRHVQRPNFTVELTLRKINAGDFDDPDVADYKNPTDVSAPVSTDYRPSAPRNLAAQPQASAILFTWDPPLDAPIGVLYQLWEYTSATPFSSAVEASPETAQTSLIIPRTDLGTRYYWVTARDPAGGTSGPSPALSGVPGAPASASGDLGALVTPGSASATTSTSSATTNSVTVTATGGTPGYTYAWTFIAGGSGITIDSSTSAATTFSSSGLTEGESRSGTARCTVTDSAAGTFEVEVTVNIDRRFEITLIPQTINSTGGSMAAATSQISVGSSGYVTVTAPATSYQWMDPAADSADYDARITLTGGTLQYQTSGWQHLATGGAAVAVGVRPPPTPGTSTQTLTVEIRMHNSPFTVLASVTVTLNETIL